MSASMVGLLAGNLAGGTAAQAACPNHSTWWWNAEENRAPWSMELAGGWSMYASGDPTSGPPSGTNGYVGLEGTLVGAGQGYIEAGGDATNPAGGYVVVGGADGDAFGTCA